MSLAQVAKIVGVSKSTVSSSLNGVADHRRISPQTVARVREVAKRLGYAPLAAAKALSEGRTYSIGYLVSSSVTMGLSNYFFASVMSGVQHVCQSRGYQCMASVYDLSDIENFIIPKKLAQRSVDGVVLVGPISAEVIQRFLGMNIPFVLYGDNTDFPLRGLLAVTPDVIGGWTEIFRHLSDLGHTRISVGGAVGKFGQAVVDVIEQFHALFPSRNLCIRTERDMADKLDGFASGAEAAKRWIGEDLSDRPTAVVGHDQWALGFLSTTSSAGFRCPDDVSVVSSVDSPYVEHYFPPLTALHQDLCGGGGEAADLLIDIIEGNTSRAEAFRRVSKVQKNSLVIRKSTGFANGSSG